MGSCQDFLPGCSHCIGLIATLGQKLIQYSVNITLITLFLIKLTLAEAIKEEFWHVFSINFNLSYEAIIRSII